MIFSDYSIDGINAVQNLSSPQTIQSMLTAIEAVRSTNRENGTIISKFWYFEVFGAFVERWDIYIMQVNNFLLFICTQNFADEGVGHVPDRSQEAKTHLHF